MEFIMMTINRIEETLVRLEERALELTMSQRRHLTAHEYELTHAEARGLRPHVDATGNREYIRRLDRVQVDLMCVREKWVQQKPEAA